MREAIGGSWLFNIVIFFILLFAGYMCLSINYSKAFSVKDKIINEIERNGGISLITSPKDETIQNITNYLQKVGYRTTGKCVDNNEKYDYGCDRDGQCQNAVQGRDYAYCLSEKKASDAYKNAQPGEFIYVSYYKVKVFYQLDLPVIRHAFNFSVKGDTKTLYNIKIVKRQDDLNK